MYAPQLLTPTLSQYFHVPVRSASLVVSATLIPLAITPIIYRKDSSQIYYYCFSICMCYFTITSHLFYNISCLFVIALFTSLIFAVILTSLLTLITRQSRQNTQRNVSLYVSATIAGGLAGRVGGSFLAEIFSCQISLNIIASLTCLYGI